MRNIVSFDTKVNCSLCGQKGFYSEGHEDPRCPRCNIPVFYNDIYDTFKDDDIRVLYDFCDTCKIVFDHSGCNHAENGCDWQIYNAHFISKYEHEGDVYEGMPLFENEEEWLKEGGKIKILETICPNKNSICPKACYPKDKHPQDYRECDLN
jgi:hypothetical protein